MEETNKKIKSPATCAVQYQGKVVVKTLNGKRVIQSKTYHNKGMPNLFKFLASALVGTWQYNQAPAYLQLFSLKDPGGTPAGDFDWGTVAAYTTKAVSATVPILFETTPKLYEIDGGYKVKYSFRIPYSLITQNTIHFAGIFPNKDPETLNPSDVLAYYLFTKSNGEWEPIEKAATATIQYNLIIEWTMVVSNQSLGGNES